MFRLKKEILANQEILTINHVNSNSAFSIIKSLGAALLKLRLKDKKTSQNILKYWDNETTFLADYKNRFGGSQLFPFPNRLAAGTYSTAGNSYRFDQNDFGRPNALHGHLYNKNFDLESWNAEKGCLVMRHSNDGSDPAFPFSYTIRNTFTLAENALQIETRISNDSNEIFPFGYGWHPYFQMDDPINNCYLQLPSSAILLVDDNMIPTGKSEPLTSFVQPKKIAELQLDNCLLIDQSETIVKLMDHEKKHCISLDISQFDYLQVYIPPERNCIAIEPQTCAPDALNNGKGLAYLQAGDSELFSLQISFSALA